MREKRDEVRDRCRQVPKPRSARKKIYLHPASDTPKRPHVYSMVQGLSSPHVVGYWITGCPFTILCRASIVWERKKKVVAWGSSTDACYDRGSPFREKWFQNGGCSLTHPKSFGKKNSSFFAQNFLLVCLDLWDFSFGGTRSPFVSPKLFLGEVCLQLPN